VIETRLNKNIGCQRDYNDANAAIDGANGAILPEILQG